MALKGCKFSEEHKKKISEALNGRKLSEESKKKISASLKGREVWNKGKKGLQTAWNKGIPMSSEAKQRLSETLKCRGGAWNKGLKNTQKHSEETKQKISNAKKGQTPWMKGKKHSEDSKRKNSEAVKKYWRKKTKEEKLKLLKSWIESGQKASMQSPSSIEIKVRQLLDELGIEYKVNQQIDYYYPDILIEDRKLIIECDGNYWHNLPKQKRHDKRRDWYLRSKGYQVIRFWEHEINNNIDIIGNHILTQMTRPTASS